MAAIWPAGTPPVPSIPNKITTVAMGLAASMGQFLLVAGSPGQRYATADQLMTDLEAAQFKALAFWENGFRNLTNSKRAVVKLEDMDGIKLRVMQNNVYLDSFKTLGANAVLLGIWLGRRGHFRLPAVDWRRHFLIVAASLVMAAVLWALAIPLGPYLTASAPLLVQIVVLGVLCTFGMALYFAIVHFSGAQPLGLLLRRLRRHG